MYRGLHSVGVGVSDMEKALGFYRDTLKFTDVLFDYTGELPGMEKLTGKPSVRARVVMLANPNVYLTANSMIRLVQLLEPDACAPIPEGIGWGEIGAAEVCVKVNGLSGLRDSLKNEYGCTIPVEPFELDGTWMFYVLDPDGGKVELLQSAGKDGEPETRGVFHVGLGVRDVNKALEFYSRVGMDLDLWNFEGVQKPMAVWYGHDQPMKEKLIGNLRGGTIELIELMPETKDCRGAWGHIGAMDFSLETTNIELAYQELKAKGMEFFSEPVTVRMPEGEWKYVYFSDPDGNYVSLIEQRF